MTHAGRRAPVAAVLAGVLAGLTALAGCAPVAAAARTAPDAVELAAVQRTTDAFFAARADPRLPWVQLWTSNQFPAQLSDCAAEESDGQLAVDVRLPLLRGLSYRIIGSGSAPDEAEASRIIERCAAAHPLDDRVLRVREKDWDALYSYELTTLKPCLVAHGFPVGPVPMRRDFESLLRAQQPWSPYDGVTVRSRSAWYRISDACPPFPPRVGLGEPAPAPTSFAG